jgi:hypothetical protein
LASRSIQRRRHPNSQRAVGVVPIAFERRVLGENQQSVGEPIDVRHPGERVVDRGAKRAKRDSELGVLCERTVAADGDVAIHRQLQRARSRRRHNRR